MAASRHSPKAKSKSAKFAFVGLGVVILGSLCVYYFELPKWQVKQFADGTPIEYRRLVDEYRKTDVQIISALGGLATLLLIWVAWKNLALSQRGQNTDRFTKAIDQLGATSKDGDPLLEIRLGGIYALDQLARQDPDEYQATVVSVLTAYLRENSKRPASAALVKQLTEKEPKLELSERPTLLDISQGIAKLESYETLQDKLPRASSDFLAVAHILRAIRCQSSIPWDLSDTYLRGVDMNGADLRGVILARSHIANAEFLGVDFSPRGKISANLVGTNWHGTLLDGADLAGAKLTAANFSSADLRHTRGLTSEQINASRGDRATRLPPEITRPPSWSTTAGEAESQGPLPK